VRDAAIFAIRPSSFKSDRATMRMMASPRVSPTLSAVLSLFMSVPLLYLPINEAFSSPTLPSSRKQSARPSSLFASQDVDTISAVLPQGLEKMKRVMTPEFFESSTSLKSLYAQSVKSVEIKESSIPGAGLGLFARKNIKANTIISFYPAHALGVDVVEGAGFICDESDQEYFQKHPSSKSSYLHCTDQPIFKRQSLIQQAGLEDTPLYLDVNPNRPIVDAWVSQMINDGATVQSNTEEGVLEYYQATKQAKNCIHIPFGPSPIMATVTTRKVKKGQEFLTSYGATYWLGVLLDVHGEEGVGVTNKIQAQIQETAVDLSRSMQSVSVVYANQLEVLQAEFDKL